jgi:membrane-bound inhibitor of C-type lysozyme
MNHLFKLFFLIILTFGCQKQNQFTYQCDKGQTIIALYKDDNSAVLTIDGKDYDLYSVVSGSGARYATEQGLNFEQGMSWHTKGDDAILKTVTLDDSAKPEDEVILFSCSIKK